MSDSPKQQYAITLPRELASKLSMTSYWESKQPSDLMVAVIRDAVTADSFKAEIRPNELVQSGEFVRLFVRLPDEVDKRLRAIASRHRVSPATLIVESLSSKLLEKSRPCI
jgi:predicted DNA-binding protein